MARGAVVAENTQQADIGQSGAGTEVLQGLGSPTPGTGRELATDQMAEGITAKSSIMNSLARDGAAELLADSRLTEDQQAMVLDAVDRILSADNLQTNELTQNREALVKSLIAEVTDGMIHQGIKNTCTVTAFENEMAKERPGEYAELIASLIVNGEATLASGDTMKLYMDRLIPEGSNKEFIGRSLSMSVFQSSAMQYGVGYDTGITYDDQSGLSFRADGTSFAGLYPEHYQKIYDNLFDVATHRMDCENIAEGCGTSADELVAAIAADIEQNGNGTPTEMWWSATGNHSLHEIFVTNIDTANGTVEFVNGWSKVAGGGPARTGSADRTFGKVETMSLELFKEKVASALITQEGKTAKDSVIADTSLRGGGSTIVEVEVNGSLTQVEVLQGGPELHKKAETAGAEDQSKAESTDSATETDLNSPAETGQTTDEATERAAHGAGHQAAQSRNAGKPAGWKDDELE